MQSLETSTLAALNFSRCCEEITLYHDGREYYGAEQLWFRRHCVFAAQPAEAQRNLFLMADLNRVHEQ